MAAPPRGLSRRAAVMAVLLLVVATAMSPFVRALVAQQSRIAALEADVAAREQRVSDLDSELERWDDPAFVIAQARQRFTYVMPVWEETYLTRPSRALAVPMPISIWRVEGT